MSEYVVEEPSDSSASWRVHEFIVRCRNCVHYVADPKPIDPGWPMMCDESGRDMLEPDGFCAWAERRDA